MVAVSDRAVRFPWLERACVIVPAFDAARTVEQVIAGLRASLGDVPILVVDDGSADSTRLRAERTGAIVMSHASNRGKGAALKTGFAEARARGFDVALTVDADGQHVPDSAAEVLYGTPAEEALVLGVRDLSRDGAPRPNRFSNGISNFFLSRFASRPLRDTQCGLRRYPIAKTLALAARGDGYDFEAEVLLRAVWSGIEVVERPIRVAYTADRYSHFHVVRDPWRIIRTVVGAVRERDVR